MKLNKSAIHNWAPRCCTPGCRARVGYHKMYFKLDGTFGAHWKSCCEYHRTIGRVEMNNAKLAIGCENKDGRLGFVCGDPSTPSLTYDHWDGDHYNNDPLNIVVLCANCHQQKTKIFKNHLTAYRLVNKHFNNLYEFE